jgi:hypothetical protein
MWQHRPIPGTATPDDEWPTLDSWSRMQDTIPWFRWAARTINAPPLPANATPQQAAAAAAARGGDARALLRGELIELQTAVRAATTRTGDAMTRLHLRDINLEIQRILDPAR